jgi:hypothetical protein
MRTRWIAAGVCLCGSLAGAAHLHAQAAQPATSVSRRAAERAAAAQTPAEPAAAAQKAKTVAIAPVAVARTRAEVLVTPPSAPQVMMSVSEGEGKQPKEPGGAPVPCTAPAPAVRASAIVSAPDDLALLEWLTAQAQAGQFVTSLAPLGNGDSIAALFGGPVSAAPGYTVTLVNGAPEPEGVKKRLALNPGKELIGLHVTSPTSFLLVLRDAPR